MLGAGLSAYSDGSLSAALRMVQLQRAPRYSVRSAGLPSRSTDVRAPCASRAVSREAANKAAKGFPGAHPEVSLAARAELGESSFSLQCRGTASSGSIAEQRAAVLRRSHLLDALLEDAVDCVFVLMQQRRDVVHVQNRGALVHAAWTSCEEVA